MLKSTIAMLAVSVCIFSGSVQAETTNLDFKAEGINVLNIKHNQGRISITGSDGDTIKISIDKVKGGSSCQTNVVPKGVELNVETEHSIFSSFTCEVDLEISVPKNVALNADVGASTLHINDILGNIKINVGAGQIEGKIGAKETSIKLGAGQVNLVWVRPITNGSIDLSVGSGVVNMLFPKESVINPVVMRGFGNITNELKVDRQSAFKINANVGFGTVSLKYL